MLAIPRNRTFFVAISINVIISIRFNRSRCSPFRCVAIPAHLNQAYRNSDILYLGALQFQRFIIRHVVMPYIQIRRTAIPISPIPRVAITGVSYPTRGNSNIAEPNALLHRGCYSKA